MNICVWEVKTWRQSWQINSSENDDRSSNWPGRKIGCRVVQTCVCLVQTCVCLVELCCFIATSCCIFCAVVCMSRTVMLYDLYSSVVHTVPLCLNLYCSSAYAVLFCWMLVPFCWMPIPFWYVFFFRSNVIVQPFCCMHYTVQLHVCALLLYALNCSVVFVKLSAVGSLSVSCMSYSVVLYALYRSVVYIVPFCRMPFIVLLHVLYHYPFFIHSSVAYPLAYEGIRCDSVREACNTFLTLMLRLHPTDCPLINYRIHTTNNLPKHTVSADTL